MSGVTMSCDYPHKLSMISGFKEGGLKSDDRSSFPQEATCCLSGGAWLTHLTWRCSGASRVEKGERRYAFTKCSSAALFWITSVDPCRVANCLLLNSPKVRVTVSREVPIT